MFGTHPASPLTAAAKSSFGGLKTADYDPIYRFHVPLTSEGAGREMNVETGTDGVVRFVRLGTFDLPEMGQLAVWKLHGYGGGIFVPFRDATAGQPGGSYGAGRYLLDTIKGAFHGVQGSGPGRRIRVGLQLRLQPVLRLQRGVGMPAGRAVEPPGRGDPGRRAVLSRMDSQLEQRSSARACTAPESGRRTAGAPPPPGCAPVPAGPAAAAIHRRRHCLYRHVAGALCLPPAVDLGPQPANATALILTSLMNTALNRRLTFKITERHRMKRDHLNGLIVILVALLITGGSLGVLHWINPDATVADELWTTTLSGFLPPRPSASPCCGTGSSAGPGTVRPPTALPSPHRPAQLRPPSPVPPN